MRIRSNCVVIGNVINTSSRHHGLVFVFYFLVLCLFVSSCTQAKLSKMGDDDLIERTIAHQIPSLEELELLDLNHNSISTDSFSALVSDTNYFPDFYVNKKSEIVQVRVRKRNNEDLFLLEKLQKRIREVDEAVVVNKIEIDCTQKRHLLIDVFNRDQAMRNGTMEFDEQKEHMNLEIILSLIEDCGIPTLEEVSDVELAAVWVVLQHGPAKYQKKYIPLLEESARRGDIKWSVIALMKDRALMHDGLPQKYGSQIIGRSLYTLEDPECVNQRRMEMDMEPLEDYLQRFGIEFNVEQECK